MSEFVQNAEQEFWRAPSPGLATSVPKPQVPAEACGDCGTEFLLGAGFCHVCGATRLLHRVSETSRTGWTRHIDFSVLKSGLVPWGRQLEFGHIKDQLGLPTGSMVAFLIGLGCALAAILTGLIFSASTVLDWQAVQVWRIEWLLGAAACFLAGILLKRPSSR